VLEISHIYLYAALRRSLGGGWWNWPAVTHIACLFAYRHLFRRWVAAQSWGTVVQNGYDYYLGFAIIACIVFAAGDAIRIAFRLALARPAAGMRRRPRPGRWAAALFGVSLLVYLYALHEARAYQVVRIEIPTALLPEGRNRVRIAAFSDLHLARLNAEKELRRIVEIINAESPDIVAAVGDTVDADLRRREGERRAFRDLQAPHRFAVVGNHEVYRSMRQGLDFLEESGLTVLRGRWAEAAGIIVAGVDDPAVRGAADSAAALAGVDQEKFVLLLAHRPPVPDGARGRFDLQLSGHTHGGQIFPARPFMRLVNGHPQGLSTLPPGTAGGKTSRLYVMNGVGFSGPPVRLLARPEILVVDVVRSGSAASSPADGDHPEAVVAGRK
jgi:predicted MPP superfamily phosphohydrolase